jgi:hypothetical protein
MIQILEKKRSRLKVITSGVILIVVLSFVSLLSSAQSVSAMPVQRDVLLVTLGNEEAPRKTSEIIKTFLNEIKDGVMSSGNYNTALGWKNNYFVSESIHCTQSIQKETQKSKLTTSTVQTSISSFDNDIARFRASIVIVVGHGSESGIADESGSGNQMAWSDVIASTTKVQSQLTILACCFSSNAVSSGSNIVGFNGAIDALLVGHVVSLLLTQVISDTPSFLFQETLGSVMHRYEEIMLDGLKILPLSIQSDWAAIRIPVITILTGFFFISAYYVKWAVESTLLSVLGAILIGAAGVVIGALFQVVLEVLRTSIGTMLQAINPTVGNTFNAILGSILGFVISYKTTLLIPSFLSALAYVITGTTSALVLSDTPEFWTRSAACIAAAIGLISILDMFIQFL